jgi:hypothetical protein
LTRPGATTPFVAVRTPLSFPRVSPDTFALVPEIFVAKKFVDVALVVVAFTMFALVEVSVPEVRFETDAFPAVKFVA